MNYYAIKTGGNWSSASTWASSTGQTVGGAGVPTTADNVFIDATLTGTVTVDLNTDVCGSLNCTGATGTLAFTSHILTVSGNITFSNTMTVTATTGTLSINANCTLNTNGLTLPTKLSIPNTATTMTLTLGSNVSFTGSLTTIDPTTLLTVATQGHTLTLTTCSIDTNTTFTGSGIVAVNILNISTAILTISSNWSIFGSLNSSGANIINGIGFNVYIYASLTLTTKPLSGTATLVLAGTGTWSQGIQVSGISMNLIIATSGTITISGTVYYTNGTLTYSSGTVVTTGSIMYFDDTPTLNTNGIIWNNLVLNTTTYILTSNLTCNGTITNQNIGVSTSPIFSGAHSITCNTLSFGALTNNVSLTIPAGQTLTVTNAMNLYGNDNFSSTILSGTTSSPMYLDYQGTYPNQEVYSVTFTDVDASSSIQPIYNWGVTTLTRTKNIFDVNGYNIAGGFTLM